MLEHDNTSNDSLNTHHKDTRNEIENEIFDREKLHNTDVVSFFKAPIKNVKTEYNLTLTEVYKLIISKVYEPQTKELRAFSDKTDINNFKGRNFDYVTFHGVFKERGDSSLINLSGFFSIDLDNLGENLQAVKDRLILDKVLCPQLIFTSPSGNGLKVVVKIDPSIIDVKKSSKIMNNIWEAINTYFGKFYTDVIVANGKMEYIDAACKDLSRACFLCHDSNAYLRLNDDNILGQIFINENKSIENEIKSSQNKSNNFGLLNIDKKLEIIANKHLMNNGNRYANLLAFVGAALSIGISKESVELFILQNVHIADDSCCKNIIQIQNLISSVYLKYNTDNEGVVFLTELEFAFKFIKFKYTPLGKQFLPYSIYANGIKEILNKAGFMKRKVGNSYIYVQKTDIVIKEVTPEDIRDYMTEIIFAIEDDFLFNFRGKTYKVTIDEIKEIYLKNSNNIFNAIWLEHLNIHNEPILKDTKDEMYFVFENQIVVVKAKETTFKSINETNGFCIWEDSIIKHTLTLDDNFKKSHFYSFLENITNNNESRLLAFKTAIGYLLHHYFRENEGQAIILYDEAITDIKKPMGGTGKGLLLKALGKLRKTTKIDGKSINNDNRFVWGAINPNTQIICIDDIKPDFNFENLFSNLTDGWSVESKYKPTLTIHPKDNPKTVISSNSIIRGNGNSNARRKFELELSDFYSKQINSGVENPILKTHGCLFFGEEWTKEEWNKFYNVLIHCGQKYLEKNLVPYSGINIKRNLLMQNTNEEFVNFVENKEFEININYETKKFYDEYIDLNYGDSKQFAQRTFTKLLKLFAQYKNWKFNTKQSNGKTYFTFGSL
jgi:hypothetical protein